MVSESEKWQALNDLYIEHAESLDKDHLVVSAVIASGRKILVIRRSKKDTYPGMWEFPGGGVDKGENVIQAIKREIKEETNLDVGEFPVSELMTHPTRTALRIIMEFNCQNVDDLILSSEHDMCYWLDIDQLARPDTMNDMAREIYATMRDENKSVLDMMITRFIDLSFPDDDHNIW